MSDERRVTSDRERMMPAISMWQPWATFVCLGWKTIETRTHERLKSLKGKRIVIHATQKVDESAFMNMYYPKSLSMLDAINLTGFVNMNRGRLLCTATVAAARWAPNVQFDEHEEWNKKAMCDVAGKFCLFLEDIEPLRERVPFKGRQGIFYVPETGTAGS